MKVYLRWLRWPSQRAKLTDAQDMRGFAHKVEDLTLLFGWREHDFLDNRPKRVETIEKIHNLELFWIIL